MSSQGYVGKPDALALGIFIWVQGINFALRYILEEAWNEYVLACYKIYAIDWIVSSQNSHLSVLKQEF